MCIMNNIRQPTQDITLKLLSVAGEMYPFIKTGGLGMLPDRSRRFSSITGLKRGRSCPVIPQFCAHFLKITKQSGLITFSDMG